MLEALLQTLRTRDPLPPLTPREVWNPDLARQVHTASDVELFGTVQNPAMAQLCRAGLLLWNDDLDALHTLSQRYEGEQTADYWHAIMHRREGDEGNARYWWRRVGQHPAFENVGNAALAVLRSESFPSAAALNFIAQLEEARTWLPVQFTALCARFSGDDAWLRRVQVAEMETLLDWCLVRR